MTAEEFKAKRKSLHWSQKTMAFACGVSPQSVSCWERGRTIVPRYAIDKLNNRWKASWKTKDKKNETRPQM